MWWVALIGLLAGCDKVLGLKPNEARDDGGIDAPGDGPPADALITCGGTVVLREDFPDKIELATKFDPDDGSNSSRIDVVEGRLVATTGVTSGYASITSNKVRDFTSGIAQVRIVSAAAPPNAETFFDVHHPTSFIRHFFSIGYDNIQMGIVLANGTVTEEHYVAYNPDVNVYFRFEHRGSIIAYSTSVDGMTWTDRHTAPVGIDLTQTVVRMGAGTYNAGSTVATSGRFDEFELCQR